MNEVIVFTDGSMNPQQKIGVGGIMILNPNDIKIPLNDLKDEYYIPKMNFIVFENTSSTKLEIETLLVALEMVTKTFDNNKLKIRLFTDSQGITSLINRKEKLERFNFMSKSKKDLHHKDSYIKFYEYLDNFNIELKKVKGHAHKSTHNSVMRIFSFLDKEVRRKLRKIIEVNKNTLTK